MSTEEPMSIEDRIRTATRAGATLVMQPRFEPDEAIDLMLEHQVNTFHGVPQMYLALTGAAKARIAAGRTGLPRLKIAESGGNLSARMVSTKNHADINGNGHHALFGAGFFSLSDCLPVLRVHGHRAVVTNGIGDVTFA